MKCRFHINRIPFHLLAIIVWVPCLIGQSVGQQASNKGLEQNQWKWADHLLRIIAIGNIQHLDFVTRDIVEEAPEVGEDNWTMILHQCMQRIRSTPAQIETESRLPLMKVAAAIIRNLKEEELNKDDLNYVLSFFSKVISIPFNQIVQKQRNESIEYLALLGDKGISIIRQARQQLTQEELRLFFSRLQEYSQRSRDPMPETADFLIECLQNGAVPLPQEEVLLTIEGLGLRVSKIGIALSNRPSKDNERCQDQILRILATYESSSLLPQGTTLSYALQIDSETSLNHAKLYAASCVANSWNEVRRFLPDFDASPISALPDEYASVRIVADFALRLARRNVIKLSDGFLGSAVRQTSDLATRQSAILYIASEARLSDFAVEILSAFKDPTFSFDRQFHDLSFGTTKSIRQLEGKELKWSQTQSLLLSPNIELKVQALAYEMSAIMGTLPVESSSHLQSLLVSRNLAWPIRHRLLNRLSYDHTLMNTLQLDWDAILEVLAGEADATDAVRSMYGIIGALGTKSESLQRRLSSNLRHSENAIFSFLALRQTCPHNPIWTLLLADSSQLLSNLQRTAESQRLIYAIHYVSESVELASAFQSLLPLTRNDAINVDQRNLLLKYLGEVHPTNLVRSEFMAEALRSISRRSKWEAADTGMLNNLKVTFAAKDMQSEERVIREIKALIPSPPSIISWTYLGKIFFTYWPVLILHPFVWALIIIGFPHSRRVQSIFIFNPKLRKFFGLGYVSALICSIPYLARKILFPFRQSLAASTEFGGNAYYADREVADGGLLESMNPSVIKKYCISDVLPKIAGKVLIMGSSGVGKSALLRYMASKEETCVAYLRAADCSEGIAECIARRLPVSGKDIDFVRGLILAGAVKIIIDGLNEAKDAARRSVIQFTNDFPAVDILIASQPLPHEFSSTVRVFWLLPLRDSQVMNFIHLQVGSEFEMLVPALEAFFAVALSPSLPAEELARNREILLNPLDLLFVSELLREGEHPDIRGILHQQHRRMKIYYRKVFGVDFPEQRFAKFIYSCRQHGDMDQFPADTFLREWDALAKFKLAHLQLAIEALGDNAAWVMRHPRICDFYTAMSWQFDSTWERSNTVLTKHAGDPRFWGAYYLLVDILEAEQRAAVIAKLLRWSAKQKNHALLDRLVALEDDN